MMNRSLLCLFMLLWSATAVLLAQPLNDSTVNFRDPIDFRMILSGTFGELRTNHFHSGIDIKTGGVQGKNIHAVDTGYVARIKVSPGGFGKAIYLRHPNGYTTVYAHLQQFNKTLAAFVKKEQYRKESFAVDLQPTAGQFPVQAGDVIGKSGNSGSSGGPHLHFEIRDTHSQEPLNPLHYGFKVKDYIRPKMAQLKVYPIGKMAHVDRQTTPKTYPLAGWGEQYRIKNYDTLLVSGRVGFGLQCWDLLNDANNKNGVYEIRLKVDGVTLNRLQMDRFAFSESPGINALIDYPEFIHSKRRFVQSYVAPNNPLDLYREVTNQGLVLINDTLLHEVVYEVVDAGNNLSRLRFMVQGMPIENPTQSGPPRRPKKVFRWQEANRFQDLGVWVQIPEGALYDTLAFEYKRMDADERMFADCHAISRASVPLFKPYKLAIAADDLPDSLHSKALIAELKPDGRLLAVGGSWQGDRVLTRSRNFGVFTVVVDTIPPVIKSINIPESGQLSGRWSLKIKVSDDFSGIDSYRGSLNGHWVLMDYDPKRSRLTYLFDKHLKKGKNHFQLEVVDEKGNLTTYSKVLYW